MSDYRITVDVRDNPIGQKHWRDMQYADVYRVSALWLTDIETGDILLAQRKWTKKHDPGRWGTAVAGTVEVDETYGNNIVKEIQEEIGLSCLKTKLGPKTFTDDGKHRFFCQWFLASINKNNVRIIIQEDEVEAVKWVPKAWLVKDIKQNPDSYTPSTPEHLRALGVS